MRILHTAPEYPPLVSGVPEVVRQVSERLARRGHEVHVATGAVDGQPRNEIRNGTIVHRFDIRGNLLGGISGETGAYSDFVSSGRWDVVVSHCAQTWSTDLLFPIRLAAPSIFVAHGLTYQDPFYREYYDRLADWLRQGRTMVSLAATGIDDAAFRADHSLPDAVIIPNGVDLTEWSSPTLGVRKAWRREDEPWLLNVSIHSPAKAHGRLFELMRVLRNKGQKAHLTQIGCGHKAQKWCLGRLGVRGGCYYQCLVRSAFDRSTTMMLNVSRADTISAIKETDVMVQPSTWEASPLVILECMAAGKPFVAFDVGCVREHTGGIVVGTLEEMAEAVSRLLADSELRSSLGEQGKQRIAERHDWEVIADAYERLYVASMNRRTEVRA